MASIGLKVDHGTAGTDTASLLAKALTTNVGDAVSIARFKLQMQNDEVTRRAQEQDILYRQALEAASRADEARKAEDARLDVAARPGATRLAIDSMGNQVVVPAEPTTEAPAPIEIPARNIDVSTPEHLVPLAPEAATTQPTYGPEPDWEYRVNQYPLRSAADTEAPAPIMAPPMPEQLTGVPQDLLSNAAITAATPALPPQLPGLPQDLIALSPMQPPVTGVPPGLTLAGLNAPGAAPAAAPATGKPPVSSLLDMLGLTGGDPEPPVPVDVGRSIVDPYGPRAGDPHEGMVSGAGPLGQPPLNPPLPASYYNTPLNTLDLPPEEQMQGPSAAFAPNYYGPPEAPLEIPVEALMQRLPDPGVPALNDTPGALLAPEVIALPGRTPEAPAAPPAPVVTESTLPTPTPPPVVKGSDGGNSDTPTTVQTKAGPMPRAEVEALVAAIWSGPDTAEQKMQATQRLMGTLGTTYNPEFGKDAITTENLASLRQGGAAVGKESQAATLTAEPALPGTAPGTAQDAWITNTFLGVQDAIRKDTPPPPSVADAYANAYLEASKPRTELRTDAATGETLPVNVPGTIDPALPTPDAVRAWANGTGPKPTIGKGTTPAAAAGQAGAGSGASAAAGTGTIVTDAGGGATVPAVTAGAPVGGKKSTPLTKEQSDNQAYYQNTKLADAEISNLKTLPTWKEMVATDPVSGGNENDLILRWMNEGVDAYARKKNPEIDKYWGAVTSFASAILRKESGAATRPEDMKTIRERYIPDYSDSAEEIETKALRRKVAMEGLAAGTFKVTDENARRAEVDAYVDQKIAEMKGVRKDAATTPPAGGELDDAALLEKYK